MNRRSIVSVLLLAFFGSIPQAHATPNLALGADTSASDGGWGGGNSKSDLVDGKATYYDTWAHGLAAPWGGGPRDFNVILDFGADRSMSPIDSGRFAASSKLFLNLEHASLRTCRRACRRIAPTRFDTSSRSLARRASGGAQ